MKIRVLWSRYSVVCPNARACALILWYLIKPIIVMLLLPEKSFFDHVLSNSKERNDGQNKDGRCFVVNPVPNSFQTLRDPRIWSIIQFIFPREFCEATTVHFFGICWTFLRSFWCVKICKDYYEVKELLLNCVWTVDHQSIYFLLFPLHLRHFFGIFRLKIHFNEISFWWRRRRRWQTHSERCCFSHSIKYMFKYMKRIYLTVQLKIRWKCRVLFERKWVCAYCTLVHGQTFAWLNSGERFCIFLLFRVTNLEIFPPSARQWRSGHQSHNITHGERVRETQHLICNPSKYGETAFNFAIFGKHWSFCVNIRKTICAILTHLTRVTSTGRKRERWNKATITVKDTQTNFFSTSESLIELPYRWHFWYAIKIYPKKKQCMKRAPKSNPSHLDWE